MLAGLITIRVNSHELGLLEDNSQSARPARGSWGALLRSTDFCFFVLLLASWESNHPEPAAICCHQS
jgi:hypothetical protein